MIRDGPWTNWVNSKEAGPDFPPHGEGRNDVDDAEQDSSVVTN